MTTLWHGRFKGGPAEALQALNDSISFDIRMYKEDIEGSRAHVRMLERVGLISESDREKILDALDQTEKEIDEEKFVFESSDEDIHTAVERRVTEIAGDAGARLHTGRSRNDQVATDLRLWVKREMKEISGLVLDFQETLLTHAKQSKDSYLPGYTHMQQAQPVLLSHHLLAHGWALSRDLDRLFEALTRADISPLGAGALAGSSLPLDPDGVAEDLGFSHRFNNSLDAVSDRDFVVDALYALALLGVHLSRIGEELILWSSTEFGFVELDDAFSTGSSMLPQKKNPDIAELARGKAGRLIGHLSGLLATLKGLPLAYNKDLQEDKEPLFDACDTVRLLLLALNGMVDTMKFNSEVMKQHADNPNSAAIDLAEYLVAKGIPFREAHAIVGSHVAASIEEGTDLADIVSSDERLGPEAAALLAPGAAVNRRTSPGGAGPEAVKVQIKEFQIQLDSQRERLKSDI
ncbi:MAG: argininosuccinate lyase [Acidimicrobiaceae bacterium]|jgi:argininosuccinate lyase|nr:argininosuccinate lyase [Acidimicrobiaceae bacterium]|tara:strand:+ start:2350 stop:3738 length:1389 start_codon:yes stop_codon:yes gene_type:complete